MKYYWIGTTIEIKTDVLPCRKININSMSFYVIFLDFKSF